jgi:hypothetical protein
MTVFMNMADPVTSSNTQGSFNKDMSAPKDARAVNPKSKGSLGKTAFDAADQFGSGKQEFGKSNSGLADPFLPGSGDMSLQKVYKK